MISVLIANSSQNSNKFFMSTLEENVIAIEISYLIQFNNLFIDH